MEVNTGFERSNDEGTMVVAAIPSIDTESDWCIGGTIYIYPSWKCPSVGI